LENVQYLVIGGWAYNLYAEPRFTGDIDFFVSNSIENQTKLRIVLEKFGFADALPPKTSPLFLKNIIMLGRPPHRIDLITQIDGVAYEQAWAEKVAGFLDGIPVNFISLNNLIQNKEATGRDKDMVDAKSLRKSFK